MPKIKGTPINEPEEVEKINQSGIHPQRPINGPDSPKASGIFRQPSKIRKKSRVSGVSIKIDHTGEVPEEDDINPVSIETIREIENEIKQKIHNVNGPLSAATYSIDYVLSQIAEGKDFTEHFRQILLDALAAIQLASDISRYPISAIEEAFGRIPLKMKTTKIEDVLEKATDPFEQKCQLNIRGDLEKAIALCDPEHLSQVIYNIIDNGIKYNDSPVKKIEILVLYMPRSTKILIRDNGLGINEEECDKVFEENYRSPSTSHKEGSGIGLFYCKKIIEQMGGSISIERNHIGIGSSFLIELIN